MLDTGVVVSPMSAQEHKKYFSHIRLVQSHLVIQNYSEQVINYLGFFKASITWVFFQGDHTISRHTAPVQFYITQSGSSLLGPYAIKALNIIINVDVVVILCAGLVDNSKGLISSWWTEYPSTLLGLLYSATDFQRAPQIKSCPSATLARLNQCRVSERCPASVDLRFAADLGNVPRLKFCLISTPASVTQCQVS